MEEKLEQNFNEFLDTNFLLSFDIYKKKKNGEAKYYKKFSGTFSQKKKWSGQKNL